jgi:6-phosphogluconolactonase
MRRRSGDAPRNSRLEQTLVADVRRVELRIVGDAEELAAAAAAEFLAQGATAIARQGRFSVALSGGSTPTRLYTLLASKRQRRGGRYVPWGKVHVFWGDERVVPPNHPESNFRGAREALLGRVPIPQANVHRIRTEARTPSAAAALYEQELRSFFALPVGQFPRFDLVLLGLGTDGHTASLFPGSEAVRERTRLVVAPMVTKLGMHRITLTLPVINNARAVMFLVSGGQKAETLARALEGGEGGAELPAQLVRPRDGTVLWLVDRAAARLFHRRVPRPE